MMRTLPIGTILYRITFEQATWPDVISGEGAFFSDGSRYNRTHQTTVYASEDPIVSLTEMAFHQAHYWFGVLSRKQPKRETSGFITNHRLWAFRLAESIAVLDILDPAAYHRLRYLPSEVCTPERDYSVTQTIGDVVRSPSFSDRNPVHGILAPSVRTPASETYRPQQVVLFVRKKRLAVRKVRVWDVILEFMDRFTQEAVTIESTRIDWTHPRFRLAGTRSIPAFQGRDSPVDFPLDTWHNLVVQFA